MKMRRITSSGMDRYKNHNARFFCLRSQGTHNIKPTADNGSASERVERLGSKDNRSSNVFFTVQRFSSIVKVESGLIATDICVVNPGCAFTGQSTAWIEPAGIAMLSERTMLAFSLLMGGNRCELVRSNTCTSAESLLLFVIETRMVLEPFLAITAGHSSAVISCGG